jgi:hypothetical protein
MHDVPLARRLRALLMIEHGFTVDHRTGEPLGAGLAVGADPGRSLASNLREQTPISGAPPRKLGVGAQIRRAELRGQPGGAAGPHTAADARAVARRAPGSRFARCLAGLDPVDTTREATA